MIREPFEEDDGDSEMMREPFEEDDVDANHDPFSRPLGFKTGNDGEALIALWLWQCQFLVIDELQCSWAKHIEIIYNWICFLSMPPTGTLPAAATIADDATVNEFKGHIVRGLGLPAAPKVGLKLWWQVLCGYHCAVGRTWCQNILRHWKSELVSQSELVSLLAHYQLGQPPPSGVGQLTSEDVHELDAAFIKSGPLRFRITSDIRKHLEFDSRDTDCICIYFDGQGTPGARGLIYRDNLLARSTTKPFCEANWLDRTSCLSCIRRSTAGTVSCLVKMDAD